MSLSMLLLLLLPPRARLFVVVAVGLLSVLGLGKAAARWTITRRVAKGLLQIKNPKRMLCRGDDFGDFGDFGDDDRR